MGISSANVEGSNCSAPMGPFLSLSLSLPPTEHEGSILQLNKG